MILIVSSTKDPASINIARKIIDNYGFEKEPDTFHLNPTYSKKVQNMTVKLIFVNEEPVYTQNITEDFFPELILFISKHSSASGIPTLSVHTPGNLSKAELGGLPRKVSISPANAMKSALLEMIRLKDLVGLDYEVSYECTHHGPSLDIPTMFVELGSAPAQWTDQKASEVVASAAMAAISNRIEYPTVLGIGGPHYNRRFTKIALTSAEAFGHIVPKYEIPQMDFEILRHCIQQTLEKVESAVFDWKGMKSLDKQRLITMLNELNIPIIRA